MWSRVKDGTKQRRTRQKNRDVPGGIKGLDWLVRPVIHSWCECCLRCNYFSAHDASKALKVLPVLHLTFLRAATVRNRHDGLPVTRSLLLLFPRINRGSPSPSPPPAAFKLRCDIVRALRTDRSWLWFTFCHLSSNRCNNLIDHLSLIGITPSFMLQSMLAMLQSPLTLLFFFSLLFSHPPSSLFPLSLPLSLSPVVLLHCSPSISPALYWLLSVRRC